MLDSSWLMAHGSRLLAHGSWLKARGSRPRTKGPGYPGLRWWAPRLFFLGCVPIEPADMHQTASIMALWLDGEWVVGGRKSIVGSRW